MEARKVQKLGSTSLVVTLPRDWVRRVNLKPGDIVYVIEEGDSLRIKIPRAGKVQRAHIVVNADKIGNIEVLGKLPSCFYILGMEDAEITSDNGIPEKAVYLLRLGSSRLSGVEVVEESPYNIKVKTLVDVSRIDTESILRQMSITISKIADSVILALRTGRIDSETLRVLGMELFRYQHLVIKYLVTMSSKEQFNEDEYKKNASYMIAASLIGLLGDYMASLALEAKRLNGHTSFTLEEREETEGLVRSIQEATVNIVDSFISEKPEKTVECIGTIKKLKDAIKRAKAKLSTEGMYFVSKLEDCARILEIVNNTAVCTHLLGKSPWVERD